MQKTRNQEPHERSNLLDFPNQRLEAPISGFFSKIYSATKRFPPNRTSDLVHFVYFASFAGKTLPSYG